MNLFFLVIKGKVLDNNWQPSAQKDKALHSFFRLRYIKVQLRRIFKGAKSVNAEKDSTIFIRFASFDLPTLEVGHLYVLSGYSFGTSLFMNSCSWSAKWNELTTGQRFGINRNFYWNYCGCNIIDCQSASCLKDRSSCKWNSQNTEVADFLVKDGICTLTEGGLCKWQNFSL